MRIYELIIILKCDNLSFLKKFFFSLKNLIFKNFCLILIFEKWGYIKLSYPIKKAKKGYYLYFSLKLDLITLNNLEFFLKFNIQVLRFFIIKLKKKSFYITYYVIRKIRFKKRKKKFLKKKFFILKKKFFYLKNNIYN